MVAALPLKKTIPTIEKMQFRKMQKIDFDVLGSFYLFLACSVNVAASGVFFYARQFHFGGSKEVWRGPGMPKYLFDICGVMKKTGG